MHSLFRSFSHLYIEDGAADYPLTAEIRSSFPRATVVRIRNYRDLFNQPRQQWREQKESSKLILAVKHGNRVHQSTEVLPQHAGPPLYYTAPVINCVYDCQYCFLQAMYRSANMVAFVNEEDFYRDVVDKTSATGPMTLSISYDSDTLGSEKFIPWTRRWLEFGREHDQATIEVRTKSANYSLISNIAPHQNAILAWSMAPEAVWKRYEKRTAPPAARLDDIVRASEAGWRVRICLDPVLPAGDWESDYRTLLEQIFSRVNPKTIEDVSVGVFRMGIDHLKNLKSRNPSLDLLQSDLARRDGIAALTHSQGLSISETIGELLASRLTTEQIVFW